MGGAVFTGMDQHILSTLPERLSVGTCGSFCHFITEKATCSALPLPSPAGEVVDTMNDFLRRKSKGWYSRRSRRVTVSFSDTLAWSHRLGRMHLSQHFQAGLGSDQKTLSAS